jgi:hypothetical protein
MVLADNGFTPVDAMPAHNQCGRTCAYPGCGMVMQKREGRTSIELCLFFYQCLRQHQFPILPVPWRHLQHTFCDLL